MILLDDFLTATGGRLSGSVERSRWSGFAHDSRQVAADRIFVAMRTESGDGHAYIADAVNNGARLIVCEREPRFDCAHILVKDSGRALRDYGRWAIERFSPTVVAVCGSVGKTTVREFAQQLFSRQRLTFRNPENFNGLTGLPLALGELGREHAFAILEMASDTRGEIAALAEIAPPKVCLLTTFDETYIEYFGSMSEIAAEHAPIVTALGSKGLLIYPACDPIAAELAAAHSGPKFAYGIGTGQLRAERLASDSNRSTFLLCGQGTEVEVELPHGGRGQVLCLLAALGAGLRLGFDPDQLVRDCRKLQAPPGRLRRLVGKGGVTLSDDSFSISPASLANGLELLRRSGGKRICVLSGFEHLGPHEAAAARRVADDLAKTDEVVFYGPDTAVLRSAARAAGLSDGQIHRALNPSQARLQVQRLAKPGDTVYVKGGPGARLEQLVSSLIADPSDAAQLCRQTRIWQNVITINPDEPVWARIDLDAITANTKAFGQHFGTGLGMIAVLKAEGYGHGALRVATAALDGGASGVAVARPGEARELREAGLDAPILVLGITLPRQLRTAILADCELTVCDAEQIQALDAAARGLGRRVALHLKLDTGMGRIGASPDDGPELAQMIVESPNTSLAGVYSHFGQASETDLSRARDQFAEFEMVLADLERAGIDPGLRHCAATAAALRIPAARLDAVRLGIGLLGIPPGPGIGLPPGCRPALSMHARVVQVRPQKAGAVIGYGTSGRLGRDALIATVGAGYGDGFRRGPRSWGPVMIRGRNVPIVGQVCMDMFMVDVTDVPEVRVGDQVDLIGPELPARTAAERTETIAYEVVSSLLSRVPRV